MLRSLLALSVAVLLAAPAAAVSFGFGCITGNSVDSCAAGEAQLSLDVNDLGGGQVSFVISNSGPLPSSVANLYVQDDLALLGAVVSVSQNSLVDFELGGEPPVLPGGTNVGFQVDGSFAAMNPKPQWGVNPGESLTVVYDIGGASFASLVAAIQAESLRFGLHVIAIQPPCGEKGEDLRSSSSFGDEGDWDDGEVGGDGDCDFSESFVNNPEPTSVPEPSLLTLLGGALAAGALIRRR